MFGIGAYATGLAAGPSRLAVLAGLPVRRRDRRRCRHSPSRCRRCALSGLYLALSTLAFAQFTQWVFLHWEAVTFGAGGFKTPRHLLRAAADQQAARALLSQPRHRGACSIVFARNIVASRIGRAFVAVRDSEIAAESLGVDLLRYKALAFAISGFYAGIAGGLYSALLNFVSPEGYDLFQMVIQKSMIIVGGLGSVAGSVLGATALVLILELLREFKGVQEIVFGAILVGFVLFMPGGLDLASSPARCADGRSRCIARRPRPAVAAARRLSNEQRAPGATT